ncbi:hypothetical protein HY311_00940 [Candidatus Nomurabacteria bacterium]|nr:hypothetical protein [Candidatus Nomurabacteria bacterium]
MRKYINYILIIITLVGILSPLSALYAETNLEHCITSETKTGITQLQAQNDCASVSNPSGTFVDPIGTCTIGDNVGPTIQSDCASQGGTWAGPYVLLAPLPCATPGVGGCDENGKLTTFDPTGPNKIGGYLNVMIRIFIGLCAVLAVVMIVIGGIEYMTTELISGKEAGKERITHAIFGLLLALGAWTLLYQINPDILGTELNSLAPVTVDVAVNDNIPQTGTLVNGQLQYTHGGLAYNKNEPYAPRAGALANLADSGATVYNAQCTTVGQTSCTSTAGLDPAYLNTIHQKCPTCALSIQGGTEFWLHGGETGSTSHGIGSPTIDLGVNSTLTNYITGGKAPALNQRYSKDGISFRYEGNHWHVGP